MSERGAGRFVWRKRAVPAVLALLLAVALIAAALLVWGSPFTSPSDSLDRRLAITTGDWLDHAERREVVLRLQLLAGEIADGRRSTALRPQYRLLAEELERVSQRLPPPKRGLVESELNALLPDLTRDRRTARERIERLEELLLHPGSPGRQGGNIE